MPNLNHLAILHGALTSLPITILFPLAAILLRTLPPLDPSCPKPVTLHRRLQWLGWLLYVTGAVVGAVATTELVVRRGVEGFGRSPHVVLGVVLSVVIVGQPVWGEVHHWLYQRRSAALVETRGGGGCGPAGGRRREGGGQEEQLNRKVSVAKPGRTCVTWLHIVGGRVVILLGMVNGGLGLVITNRAIFRDRLHQLIGTVFYAVAAGSMGLWYLWVMTRFEMRQRREKKTSVHGLHRPAVLETQGAVYEHASNSDREMQMLEAQHPNAARPVAVS